MKLLTGMNALGKILGKFKPGKSQSPHGCKEEKGETHFLLWCKATATARRELLEWVEVSRSCLTRLGTHGGEQGASAHSRKRAANGSPQPEARAGETRSCSEFYSSSDDDGEVLFLLGCPVDGGRPDLLVQVAYDARCRILTRGTHRRTISSL